MITRICKFLSFDRMHRGVKSRNQNEISEKTTEIVSKMTDKFFQNNRYMQVGFVLDD